MNIKPPLRIKTISEFHKLRGLSKPEHPLISVLDVEVVKHLPGNGRESLVFGFYLIALKRNCNFKFKYGQQEYDFDNGLMSFMSPNQVLKFEPLNKSLKQSGWLLLIHPDFLWNSSLAKKMSQYEYFEYSVHEALFLSEKEEQTIIGIIQNIQKEYHLNIDTFSQDIIIAQLEVLFNYANRFYHRQFITRNKINHQILEKIEKILAEYFESNEQVINRLPKVSHIAESLNLSPNYLSGLLKILTGQSTQQHIHNKLIEKAKEKLSTTELSVSEIAYRLGFEHPQSFSRLFKTKTTLSPLEFRESFN